jgi:hypothetical protein
VSAPTDVALEARTITVDRLEPYRSGYTNGKRWTLYTVHALDEKGDPIGGPPLRTFQPLAGTVEVSFDPRHDPVGNIESFTLRDTSKVTQLRARRSEARAAIVGHSRTPATPPANELDALTQRVDELEARLELALSLFTPPERSA